MSKKVIAHCCLVVDASIAHVAGGYESQYPTGIRYRDFLIAIRSISHSIAWSEPIRLEWDRHSSAFALQWRVSMLNLKKLRVVHTSSIISEKIQVECKDSDVLAIVLKDCHLLEAALATDSRIASLDEKARHHCAELAVAIEEMRAIIWVNPDVPEEGAIEWLEQGAPAEKRRRLRGA